METNVFNARAYDQECLGCKKFKAKIMLSLQPDAKGDIHDFFLTTEQAKGLVEELTKRLQHNAKTDFQKLLEDHDWYYNMSGDMRVWNAGNEQRKTIEGLAQQNPELKEMYIEYGNKIYNK